MQKTGRRILAGILIPVSASFILAGTPVQIYADNTVQSAIYELDMNDRNPLYTLKKEMIQEYVEKNPVLKMENVDLNASSISAPGFDRSKAGLQTVKATLTVVTHTIDNKISSYSHTETAAVKLKQSDGPQIILKASEVTVDLGSVFNYADNIGIASTEDGDLPAITETDNVDVNTEGSYTVNLTAVDQQGATSAASYTVTVEKPAEVVQQEQEEEEKKNLTFLADGVYTDSDFRSIYMDDMLAAAQEGAYTYYFQKDSTSPVQCVDLVKYLFCRKYGKKCASVNGQDVVVSTAAMYPSEFIVTSQIQDGVFFSCRSGTVYGHTGYVNRVDGDTVYITEANIPINGEVYVRVNYAMPLSQFLARGSYDFLIPVQQ